MIDIQGENIIATELEGYRFDINCASAEMVWHSHFFTISNSGMIRALSLGMIFNNWSIKILVLYNSITVQPSREGLMLTWGSWFFFKTASPIFLNIDKYYCRNSLVCSLAFSLCLSLSSGLLSLAFQHSCQFFECKYTVPIRSLICSEQSMNERTSNYNVFVPYIGKTCFTACTAYLLADTWLSA